MRMRALVVIDARTLRVYTRRRMPLHWECTTQLRRRRPLGMPRKCRACWEACASVHLGCGRVHARVRCLWYAMCCDVQVSAQACMHPSCLYVYAHAHAHAYALGNVTMCATASVRVSACVSASVWGRAGWGMLECVHVASQHADVQRLCAPVRARACMRVHAHARALMCARVFLHHADGSGYACARVHA